MDGRILGRLRLSPKLRRVKDEQLNRIASKGTAVRWLLHAGLRFEAGAYPLLPERLSLGARFTPLASISICYIFAVFASI